MKTLFVVLLILTGSLFGEVLFEDNFNDGSAADWNVISGTWFVNDSLQYETTLNGMSWNGDSSGVMSTTDYSIIAQVRANTGGGEQLVEILARAREYSSSWQAQSCQLYFDDGLVSLLDFSDEVASTSYSLTYDQWYWVKFECFGDSLRAKVWTGLVEDEPTAWLLEGEAQTGPSHEGSIGLYAWQFAGDNGGVYDNICVETLELSLEAATWGCIKSTIP